MLFIKEKQISYLMRRGETEGVRYKSAKPINLQTFYTEDVYIIMITFVFSSTS